MQYSTPRSLTEYKHLALFPYNIRYMLSVLCDGRKNNKGKHRSARKAIGISLRVDFYLNIINIFSQKQVFISDSLSTFPG